MARSKTYFTAAAVAGSGTVYIRVALIDPNRDDVTPVVRYRVADVGGGVPGAWVEQKFPDAVPDSGLIVLNTNPVPANTEIDVEAAYIGSNGSYGDWSDTETIISTVDSTPPAVVENPVGTGGVAQAVITWDSPNSGNYFAANIRRNTSATESGSTLVRTEYGAPSSPDTWTDIGVTAGTFYYFIRSVNASGVESTTAAATGAVIVT